MSSHILLESYMADAMCRAQIFARYAYYAAILGLCILVPDTLGGWPRSRAVFKRLTNASSVCLRWTPRRFKRWDVCASSTGTRTLIVY